MRALYLALALTLLSCEARPSASTSPTTNGGPWRMPARPFCGGTYTFLPAARGALSGAELVEVSGVVASPSNAGVLWLHNDSGDEARLFAVATDGRPLGQLELVGVAARDLEDIAAGPCPDASGPCLWVADTGDNLREREDAAVYAFPEPALSLTRPLIEASAPRRWRFPVSYPGGAVDAEALVVAPEGGAFFLFEKTDAPEARVFASPVPLVEDVPLELEEVARLTAPGVDIEHGRMITGADLHPSGLGLAVRVYTGVYEYRLDPDRSLAQLATLEPTLVALGPLAEPQGEAISYDDRGYGLWTVSEDPEGRGGQPLHHYDCE